MEFNIFKHHVWTESCRLFQSIEYSDGKNKRSLSCMLKCSIAGLSHTPHKKNMCVHIYIYIPLLNFDLKVNRFHSCIHIILDREMVHTLNAYLAYLAVYTWIIMHAPCRACINNWIVAGLVRIINHVIYSSP